MPPSSVPFPNKTWQRLAMIFALVSVLAGITYLSLTQPQRMAPNVPLTTLTGKKFSLQNLHGKVVLVNFWAPSCVICIHEMPQLVSTYRQYKDKGFELVAVAMSYDAPNLSVEYAQSRNLPFPVVLDMQDDLTKAFGGIPVTPTTFLIGRDGRILKRFQGEMEFPALDRLLDQALTAS